MATTLGALLTDLAPLETTLFRPSPPFLDGLTYLILFGAAIWILLRRIFPETSCWLPASAGALILSAGMVWAELHYGFRLGSLGPVVSGLVTLALLIVLGGVVLFLRKRAKVFP